MPQQPDLNQFMAGLKQLRHAPTEKWDPPYCGELPIRIATNGDWLYQESPIQRMEIVKLFASVLQFEGDEYFLVTPVEKVKISVDDVPFVITNWRMAELDEIEVIQLETNLAEQFPLTPEHQVEVVDDRIYIEIQRGLRARVHRNVYYQWIEMADRTTLANGDLVFSMTSANARFEIGRICAD